jgi:hypothetical protein
MMIRRLKPTALACAAALVCSNACWPDVPPPPDGSCSVVSQATLDCRVTGYGEDELLDVGLVGYSCTGSARPDYEETIVDGVPQGLLCGDKGPLEDDEEGYCCTDDITPCAYDPKGDCEEGESGYECWSNNRPESLNPSLLCSNGTEERGRTNYCCTGTPEDPPCAESDAAGCTPRLQGFLCQGDHRPRGENLGANRSRADYFYPVCTTGEQAPNPEYKTFCCYMPLLRPEGGTCLPHPAVPGCDPGRFGFSCLGPDHPEDNYPPIVCPDPGFDGTSAEGYEATLYCCDLNEP